MGERRGLTTWAIAVGVMLAAPACALSSPITRETAVMTPAEIAELGLICRVDTPADSNMPRTICASEQAWAAFDRQTQQATADFFAVGRTGANTGRFVR